MFIGTNKFTFFSLVIIRTLIKIWTYNFIYYFLFKDLMKDKSTFINPNDLWNFVQINEYKRFVPRTSFFSFFLKNLYIAVNFYSLLIFLSLIKWTSMVPGLFLKFKVTLHSVLGRWFPTRLGEPQATRNVKGDNNLSQVRTSPLVSVRLC